MADIALSRLFERYRSGNDLAALAEVFDRVSPDLLRVARHVAGRGVEPEDLVQATFLAAIERAETFDASRPLLPWLLGILVNQSRRVRRRENRLLAEDSEATIPARPDHEGDAEANEIDAAVTRALAELPENYREVLVPHLSQGKEPHVIARELGRPQGTVRAQIHRGLRLMRRLLPSGFALGGYAGVSHDAVERVRASVLEHAARRGGHGPEALADFASRRAAQSLRRKVVLAGAAGIIGVALWLAWPESDTGANRRAVETASVPGLVAPSQLDLSDGRKDVERAALTLPAPDAPTAGPVQEFGTVVVQVHESDSDAPAEGVRVSMIAWGTPRWFENIRDLRSDENGLVRFEHVPTGRVAVHVERGEQSRDNVTANKETTFVVHCPRAITLDVLVSDVAGRPIAGAVVDVHARRDEPALQQSAPTDATGRTRIERAPNECFLAARADGYVTSAAAWAGLRRGKDETPVRLAFELASGGLALDGLVVDDRGASIAGARVVVASAVSSVEPKWRADGAPVFEQPPIEARSDASGRFHIGGLEGKTLMILVESPGRSIYAAHVTPIEDRYGFETVRLGCSASLKGVTRLTSGAPAPGAHIEIVIGGERVRDTFSDLDGKYVLDGLPSRHVIARARVGAYGPYTEREIALDCAEAAEWNPTLVGAETIEGRAIGQDGRPISTWLVLATPESPSSDPAQRLTQWSRQQVPAPVDDLAVQSWIASTGIFVVPCRSTSTHRIELRARAAWRDPPQTYVEGVRPGARDVVLRVVKERGHIQGRFLDERGRAVAMSRVIAVASGATGELPGVLDAGNGRFDVETLSGTYELLAWTASGAIHHFGTVTVPEPRIVDLGDLVVHECGELEVSAPDVVVIGLELVGPSGLSFELVPVAKRTWRAKALQPGPYVLRVQTRGGKDREERVEIESGAVARFTCTGT